MMHRRSRYDRRFKLSVPLRYWAAVVAILMTGFVLWPETEKPSDRIETAFVTEPYVSKANDLDAQVEVEKTATQKTKTSVQDLINLKPKVSFDAYFENREKEKAQNNLAQVLNNLAPAAGQPLEVSGVFLPEPRPTLFKAVDYSPENIRKGFDKVVNKVKARPKTVKIKAGDTLADALVKGLNVSGQDAHYAVESFVDVFDPRDIKPGHVLTAYTIDHQGQSMLMAVTLDKDILSRVISVRLSERHFAAGAFTKPTKTVLKTAYADIENSLYVAAHAQDVPDRIILELIRIYSWSIDFQRDIQKNDRFEILYEEHMTEDGTVVPNKGNILYSTLMLGKRPYPMYRYEMLDGRVDFFEPDGHSIRKALMKTPIDGARLSSGFGMRMHPILGYRKAHKGLDFAAPTGTPIYAAGDGVIERLGTNGAYGKYIRIKHRQGLHTAYAHLNGYKRGLRSGSRVKQGDVIGYVGTTGRSTGPHLHYEVHVDGRKVNPRTVKLPTGEQLKGQDLKAFQQSIKRVKRDFAKLSPGGKTLLSFKADN